jgi:hypothetical protein
MAIEFKWAVEKMAVSGDANLVTQVYWRCDATDDQLATAASGICNLVEGDSFIPYDQLTQQQVLNWCFGFENFKNDVETQVSAQIASQVAQKAAEPALPWATVALPE